MAILGKSVVSTSDTHIYTVPANKKAVLLISATNTHSSDVSATISIRQNVDYQVGNILIEDEGSTYNMIPKIKFSNGDASGEVISMKVKSLTLKGNETGYNLGNVLTASDASNKVSTDVNFKITVTAVDSITGRITGFNVSTSGKYSNLIPSGDNITLSGGTGVGATLNTVLYGLNEIQVTNVGGDYTSIPTITTVDPTNDNIEIGNGLIVAQMVSDQIRKQDAIEYNTNIPFGSVLERSAIVLGAGDSIYAKCNIVDSLNVMIFGIEEIA